MRKDLQVASLLKRLGLMFAAAMLVIVAAGGMSPVAAHGGHDHHPVQPSVSAASAAPIATREAAVIDRVSVGRQSSDSSHRQFIAAHTELPPPATTPGTCCCGSVACHAGVPASQATFLDGERFSEKVELRPVIGAAKTIPGGIERPPRGLAPL
jgi:hypothetical protein